MRASSASLSTLKQPMSWPMAASISACDLPTPENTTCAGSPPARNTRPISPPETTSNPAPSRAKRASTAKLLFAFTA